MTIVNSYVAARAFFSDTGTIMADGMEKWPITAPTASYTNITKFTGGTYTLFIAIELTNGFDNHAWLSQRTDVAADQWLYLIAGNATVDAWVLGITAKGVADLGIATATTPLNESQLRRVLKHVTLYTCKASDPSVHTHMQLDKYILSNVD